MVFGPLTAFYLWAIPRMWRSGWLPLYRPRSRMSWPQATEMQRRGPSSAIAMGLVVLAIELDYFLGVATPGLKIIVYGAAFLAVVAAGLALSVIYAHRPQWLIPPALRDPAALLPRTATEQTEMQRGFRRARSI